MKKVIPAEIISSLENDFKWQDTLLFCQMSTQSQGTSHNRTLRLYGIEDEHGLIFLTRNTSRKWHDLKSNPQLAVCILHPKYHVQIQAECRAQLTENNAYPELYEKYWAMIRADVKKIYHEDYQPNVVHQHTTHELTAPRIAPPSFGMIMAMPYFWEHLLIHEDYLNSIRYHFTRDGDQGWIKSRLTIA